MPGTRNLTAYRGDTFTHTLRFEDESGTPIDMSAATWLCQVRPSSESSVVLATMTVDDTDAATGIVVLELSHTTMASMRVGVSSWDIEDTVTHTTWLAGSFTVKGDVSRV